ncbi:MAG: TetR/AcrR family transcriptional regulator [Syntrophaceae bacterium]|nr:TetR/AcrR family transcriptional regulator [Syntrophaceae bacterium]
MKKLTPYLRNKARIPKQARGIKTKEKIIAAAAALLSQKGYHNIDTPEIAAKAKVATGTFYSYFNNKRDIFLEIMHRKYKNADEKVFSIYIPKYHKNKVDNYREVKRMIHFMINGDYMEYNTNPQLLKEMLAMILLDKEIEEKRLTEERKLINILLSYMKNYKKNIRISDLEASAALLYKMMDNMVLQIKLDTTGVSKKRLLKEIEDMVCRYLLN